METALEEALELIRLTKEKVALIEKLKSFIELPIMTLQMSNHNWITLADQSLEDAMEYMEARNLIYHLHGEKSDYNNNEKFQLIADTVVDDNLIRIFIPINDIKDKVMQFTRSGSTSRSKAIGIMVINGIAPFTRYKIVSFGVNFYK